ncbi:hypothetical protein ACPXCE_16680 [Streptomyces sp. DT24]|uniref:hypothetical protein n=1 Tax=Streptomyces sp. DT24 TaxID=3416520 RepID=UPI003CFA79CA
MLVIGNGMIPTDELFGENVVKNDSDVHGGFWESDGQNLSLDLINQARVATGRDKDVISDEQPADHPERSEKRIQGRSVRACFFDLHGMFINESG